MVSLSPTHQPPNFNKASPRIVKVLASGRFPVILVEDSKNSQIFVLKLFPLSENTATRAFLQEASVLNLVHPNIIKLYQVFPTYSLTGDNSANPLSAVAMEHAIHGDLCKLLKTASQNLSEEAVRTLFHQLIEGLEFLHSQGLAHLDLKPDNLFLGKNFTLKIGDFDQVTLIENACTSSKGTPGYRAPELQEQNCFNLPAADVFSAGVVLFVMKGRVPPFMERKATSPKSVDLYEELIKEDNSRFWEIHCRHQKDNMFFSEAFKDLFVQMLHPDPEKRLTLQDIKKSEWYNGSTLEHERLKDELSRL